MTVNSESAPLLGNKESKNYYFLNSEAKNDVDRNQEVEEFPTGSSKEDFMPRVLGARGKV
jgi:hypothetical protein